MRRSFRDVADDAGPQGNTPAIDAQPSSSFENMTDDILVVVLNLRGIRAFAGTKGNQAGSKLRLFDTTRITNLLVDFRHAPQGFGDLDNRDERLRCQRSTLLPLQ